MFSRVSRVSWKEVLRASLQTQWLYEHGKTEPPVPLLAAETHGGRAEHVSHCVYTMHAGIAVLLLLLCDSPLSVYFDLLLEYRRISGLT